MSQSFFWSKLSLVYLCVCVGVGARPENDWPFAGLFRVQCHC